VFFVSVESRGVSGFQVVEASDSVVKERQRRSGRRESKNSISRRLSIVNKILLTCGLIRTGCWEMEGRRNVKVKTRTLKTAGMRHPNS
jgi:hypothetical protein